MTPSQEDHEDSVLLLLEEIERDALLEDMLDEETPPEVARPEPPASPVTVVARPETPVSAPPLPRQTHQESPGHPSSVFVGGTSRRESSTGHHPHSDPASPARIQVAPTSSWADSRGVRTLWTLPPSSGIP